MSSPSNASDPLAEDAAIVGLDHVIIAVHDLDAERSRAERLGFTATEITAHVGWGTANTCIMFPGLDGQGDYVEILGIRDPSVGTNGLKEHLDDQGEGLLSLALKGKADKAVAAFDAQGITHFGIESLHRDVQVTPGTQQRASFRLVRPQRGPFTPIPLFVCEHRNSDIVWAERFLSHANGTIGIRAVQIMLPKGQSLGAGYEALLTGAFSGSAAGPVGADLEFYKPDDWQKIYGGTEATEAILYQVADLDQTGAFLAQSGLKFRVSEAGFRGYIIEPWDAGGVYLGFTEASA